MSADSTKIVLITGASSGIGEATAYELAKQGHKLVLGARRTDRLEQVVERIKEQGGEAVSMKLDVTQRDQLDDFARFALDTYGRIDVLVNNAGLMPLSRLSAQRVEDWDRMIDVNIKGVLYGIAAVLPYMREQKKGQVINVASVAGLRVRPTSAVYSATKYAVRAISEGLRQEEPDIRVCSICPGATKSELPDSVTDPEAKKNLAAIIEQAIPAEAIARAIAYAVAEPGDVDENEIVVRPTVAGA